MGFCVMVVVTVTVEVAPRMLVTVVYVRVWVEAVVVERTVSTSVWVEAVIVELCVCRAVDIEVEYWVPPGTVTVKNLTLRLLVSAVIHGSVLHPCSTQRHSDLEQRRTLLKAIVGIDDRYGR